MWAARGSAVTIQEMVSGPVSENVHGKSVHKQNRNSVRFPVVDSLQTQPPELVQLGADPFTYARAPPGLH